MWKALLQKPFRKRASFRRFNIKLSSVEFHGKDRPQMIHKNAFFKCNNLEYVCLPRNVRYIGKWVFHGCNRLKVLEIRHDPEFIGEWIINRAATILLSRI